MSVYDLPQQYSFKQFAHMKPQGPHMPITESYVSIPPALFIRDEQNTLWTLGFDYDEREWRGGRFEYDIVRNGEKTGDFGRIIEFRGRRLRIWGSEGWRTWNGRCFV
jgi:hypothetical protein